MDKSMSEAINNLTTDVELALYYGITQGKDVAVKITKGEGLELLTTEVLDDAKKMYESSDDDHKAFLVKYYIHLHEVAVKSRASYPLTIVVNGFDIKTVDSESGVVLGTATFKDSKIPNGDIAKNGKALDAEGNLIPLRKTPNCEYILDAVGAYAIHSGDATKSMARIKELASSSIFG